VTFEVAFGAGLRWSRASLSSCSIDEKGLEIPKCAASLQWQKVVVADRERYCIHESRKNTRQCAKDPSKVFATQHHPGFGRFRLVRHVPSSRTSRDVPNIDTEICLFLLDLWYPCSCGGYCGTTIVSHMPSEVRIGGVSP